VSPTNRGQFRVLIRKSGWTLITPQRSDSAHLHRPWRAIHYSGRSDVFSAMTQTDVQTAAIELDQLLAADVVRKTGRHFTQCR
jgi:hypothetical protein